MSEHEESGETQDQLFQQRLRKLEALRAQGNDPFVVERCDRSHTAAQVTDEAQFAAQENQTVSIAGRLVARRNMGKAAFAHLADESGRVQIYVRLNDVGEAPYEQFKDLTDLGDFLGVHGYIFRTKTGEISVHVQQLHIISKAMRVPPFGKLDAEGQTHNALADVEDRYRYRYLDLIANPESRLRLTQRSRIVSSMRRFLDGKGFLEVETPVLQQ
ncbi:MAG: lysyl-tRNA synthetase, class, partial [Chthonomonadales bacterium]|nr:lysyl-tRNA synthetase, class [Chthonomonadales bacterium]